MHRIRAVIRRTWIVYCLLGVCQMAYAGNAPDEFCGLVIGSPIDYVIQPGDAVLVPVFFVAGQENCIRTLTNPFENTSFDIAPATCEDAAASESALRYNVSEDGEVLEFNDGLAEGGGTPIGGLVGYLEVSALVDAEEAVFDPCSKGSNPLNFACPGISFRISTTESTTVSVPPCVEAECLPPDPNTTQSVSFFDYYPFLTGVTRSESEKITGFISQTKNTAIAVLGHNQLGEVDVIEEVRNSITIAGSDRFAGIESVYYGIRQGRMFQAPSVPELMQRIEEFDVASLFATLELPLDTTSNIAAIRRYSCVDGLAGLYGDIRANTGLNTLTEWDESDAYVILDGASLKSGFFRGEAFDFYSTSFNSTTLTRNSYRPIGGEFFGITPIPVEFPETCGPSCLLKAEPTEPTSALTLGSGTEDHVRLVIDLGENPSAPVAFTAVARFVQDTALHPRIERRIRFDYDVVTDGGDALGDPVNDDNYVGIAQRENFDSEEEGWSLVRGGHGPYPDMADDLPRFLHLPLSSDGYTIEYAASDVLAEGRAWTEDELGNAVPLEFFPAIVLYDHAMALGVDTITKFGEMDMNGDGMQAPRELLFHYPYLQPEFWPVSNRLHTRHVNFVEAFRAVTDSAFHDADVDKSLSVGLSELLRVIQIFAVGGYGCSESSEFTKHAPGFSPNPLCVPHIADNHGVPDYRFDLTELLRVVQIYNAGSYTDCLKSNGNTTTEDGFCPEQG